MAVFCSNCGKSLSDDANFCSACGRQLYTPPPASYVQTRLIRPRQGRMIAGVCAGFALHYGWDLTLVRVITALIALFTGIGAVAYLILWVIIPEAPYALPAKGV